MYTKVMYVEKLDDGRTLVWLDADAEDFFRWASKEEGEDLTKPDATVIFSREQMNELVVRHLTGPMGHPGPMGPRGVSS